MRAQSSIWTGLAGITLAAALALILSLQLREPLIARPNASARVAAQHGAAEPIRIVPADVLERGALWSPLTGDGSN